MRELDRIARGCSCLFYGLLRIARRLISAAHADDVWKERDSKLGQFGRISVFGVSSRIKARKNMTVAIEAHIKHRGRYIIKYGL